MKPSSTARGKITNEMKMGVARHQAGNLALAERHYQTVLSVNPRHADALHLSGVIAHQRGSHKRAIQFIEEAIRNNSNCSLYHNNLGAVLKETGETDKAIACYKKAILLKPDYAEAAYNLGSILLLTGKVSDSAVWYERAIQIKPDYVDALSNLAAAYNQLNRPDDAILCCQKVLAIEPGNAVALNNLGNAMMAKKRPDHAVDCYQKSISQDQANPEAHSNLGNAYHDSGDPEQALTSYRQALILDPTYGEAYNNMGIVLREQGRIDEAVQCYRSAMQLRPGDAEAFHNMGNVLKDKGLLDQAAALFRHALDRNPASIDSHINLGIVQEELGLVEEAIQSYTKALEISPTSAKAYSHLVHQLQHVCAWRQLDLLNEKLDALTQRALKDGIKPDEMPFLNLARHADPHQNYCVARAWSQDLSKQISKISTFYPPGRSTPPTATGLDKPITIGYLSNNFKNHPTAHLVQGMFRLHDRQRFKVYCYSYGRDDQSHYRERIRSTCDRFVDISMLSHIEAAKRIHADGVDILVDLVGYMKGNRLLIPAMRPAPVQVRWLGLAGTTGADFFDYLITDAIVSPLEHAPFYSEALVHMPDCYQINDNTQPLAGGDLTRDEAGLPNDAFVFCSFCSRYKYDPVMFQAWMRILNKVPGSVLWLLGGNAFAERNLRQFAESCGIGSHRIVFAKKIPREDHLQRLQLADLALDTRIVNGAITTSEALWAGVPLVTLQGSHFASRMSSSILSAAKMPEMVTHSLDEYEALTVRLASDSEKLKELHQQLRQHRLSIPLFDTHRFVRNLESAYLEMHQIHYDNKDPGYIRVSTL